MKFIKEKLFCFLVTILTPKVKFLYVIFICMFQLFFIPLFCTISLKNRIYLLLAITFLQDMHSEMEEINKITKMYIFLL